MELIEVNTPRGGIVKVLAEIVGQHGVCNDEKITTAYAIIHIKTKYGLGCFSAEHVAVNFAKRLNDWYDLDDIAPRLLAGVPTDNDLLIVDEIKRMLGHETFTGSPHPVTPY